MKQGAIFDMDGLLFDTERMYGEGWDSAADAFGVERSAEFKTAVAGTNGATMLHVIHHYYPGIDARRFMEHCLNEVAERTKDGPPMKPGVREILGFFRERGVKTAVASSTALVQIKRNLRLTALEPHFDAVASGQEVDHGKPAPDVFLLAAERIGVAPENCYVFEDGINGMRAAFAAGCAGVMIPDQFQPTPDVMEQAAGIYASLNDAIAAIQNAIVADGGIDLNGHALYVGGVVYRG